MKPLHFVVLPQQVGKRLDLVLANDTKLNLSRSLVAQLIKLAQIKVNQQAVKPNYLLKPNDQISIVKVSPAKPKTSQNHLVPQVIFENQNVIVVNKPAGLVVYPPAGSNQNSVVDFFKPQIEPDETDRAGVVHRLDKDTSGVMILAKNKKTKQFLQLQFKHREVTKTYTALVEGHLKNSSAFIDLPIARSKKTPAKMAVDSQGKRSLCEYQVVREYSSFSLLTIKLYTGRTHQIRVVFSHLNHPIVGDKLYGSVAKKTAPTTAPRQFLHASELELSIDPNTKQTKTFKAPLAVDLEEFLKQLT